MTPDLPPDVAERFADEDDAEPIGAQGVLFGDKPEIRMTAELADVIDDTVRAMARDPQVYSREGTLVQVVRTSKGEAEASTTVVKGPDGKMEKRFRFVEGSPRVRELPVPTLRERLTRVATFIKWNGRAKGWVRDLPIGELVAGVHARGEWDGLRELLGVIETPSMRPDGSLIEEPGYDPATRFLYAPALAFPGVPDAPSQADAARALVELADVFCDFPFASEAARYVPIAALLSIIARPAIAGAVPAFLFDAPTPGTGKSLCADAVCMIATGRAAPRGTFPTQPEELEKILAAYALRSASIVGFDNVEGGFGGAALDKCLTTNDTVDLRVLGRTEMMTMRWLAVVLASGNNLAVLRDSTRRVVIARLESVHERPEERTGFKHKPLLPWVLSERGRLVVAALTVLRAFVVAGRPGLDREFGGFEFWSDLVVAAIVFAGGENVLDARPTEEAGDTGERGTMLALLDGLKKLDPDSLGISLREVLHLLYPSEREPGPPDGHDALREALETLAPTRQGVAPDAKKVGAQLRRYRNRVVGGKRLTSKQDRNGIARWRIEHVA